MHLHLFSIVALLIAFGDLSSAHAQKSSFSCLAGDCKNGKGVQAETIRYPKSGLDSYGRKIDTYEYFVHIATFHKGLKQGKGLRIALSSPTGCFDEIKQFAGETDPEKIPDCASLQSIEQVTYKNDQVGEGAVVSFPFLDKIRSKSGWYAYEKHEDFTNANHHITEYEVPTKIVLYKTRTHKLHTYYVYNKSYTKKKEARKTIATYEIDSIFIYFENGYYAERHRPEGVYYERMKDGIIEISYAENGSKWIISNKRNKDEFTREIFFREKNILYHWPSCQIFSFPDDQRNYQELQIDDLTFYKGGTKGNKPHGFGIWIRTLDRSPSSSEPGVPERYDHTELIYSGYFVDGKKSCTGLETKRRATYAIDDKGTRVLEASEPYYTQFGNYENDRIVFGKTLIYDDRNDIVYEGTYGLHGTHIYPSRGTKYERDIPSSYNTFQLVKREEGYFDQDGALISGKSFDDYGDYTIVRRDGANKAMVKAANLYLEDVVLIDGVQKMVLQKDLAGNVYFTDGTFVEADAVVEKLPSSYKEKFMCPCSTCNGQGYTTTTHTYTETDTYNKQEVERVDYLGYSLVKTYRVRESRVRTHTSRQACTHCSGRGKVICR